MKRISFAVAALAVTPCFAAASAATIDGTWRVDGSVQGNPVTPVCTIVEKAGKLTGSCNGVGGKPATLTGTVADKTIKFQYDSEYQGSAITVFFTGSMDKDDHLTGGIFVEPYAVDGAFTATRDKAGAAPEKPTTPPAA